MTPSAASAAAPEDGESPNTKNNCKFQMITKNIQSLYEEKLMLKHFGDLCDAIDKQISKLNEDHNALM